MTYQTPTQAMTVTDYAMFTIEGNYMVDRIVEAGVNLKATDGAERVWAWAEHELAKLGQAEGFEEATDTAVREAVYDKLICG